MAIGPSRRPFARGCPEAADARRARRVAQTTLASLMLALGLPGVFAYALPPQRRSAATLPAEPPAQPIPVQVVPPTFLNPQFGAAGAGSDAMPGELGVIGPPSVTAGSGNHAGSGQATTQPGVDATAGPLPNAEAKVSLRAEDQDVRQVLALLGRQAEVNILIAPGVQGSVEIDLQDVTFRQALEAVLKLASLAARQENGLVYVYSLEEFDTIKSRERRPQVRVYHLNYVRATDLQLMIQPFLSPDGAMTTTPLAAMGLGGGAAGLGGSGGTSAGTGAASGGAGGPTAGGSASNAVDTGGNTMAYHDAVIIRDYVENLEVIDEIVKRIDTQPPQVLIEAVILSVRLRDEQELGVNFSIVDNLERLAAVSGDANAINAAAGFTPARVLAANVTRPGAGQLAPGYLNPLQGLKFGFISNNVTGFIRAVETFNKLNILASPRILVLNKQRAEIQLGQRLGFRNTVTNLTSSLQTVEFLSVGTLLTLRPFVSNDGMIRLEIHPEKSTGALDAQGIPQTNTSELTTNILVPDGATIVIGGLIDDEDSTGEQGTPGLNRLPLVGALFRGRSTTATKNELIVLLTPRVLRQGGLPDPVAGVAPRGVLGLPNSGAMPGAALAIPSNLTDDMGRPLQGRVLAPPSTFRLDSPTTDSGMLAPSELPPLPASDSLNAPPFSPRTDPAPPVTPAPGPAGTTPPPPQPLPPDTTSQIAPRGLSSPQPHDPATRPANLDPVPAANPVMPAVTSGPLPSTARPGAIPVLDRNALPPAPTNGPNPEPSAALAPAADPNPPSAQGWRHIVRPGEDFVSIAQRYYGAPGYHRALWAANRATVSRPDALRAGQSIVIPPASALDLTAGELPSPLSSRERSRTPAPRQEPPAVSTARPPDRSARRSSLFHWRSDRRETPKQDEPSSRISKPSLNPPSTSRVQPPNSRPPAALAAATPAPSHTTGDYHPGDLTRSLVQHLFRRDHGMSSDEDDASPSAMPQRLAPGVAIKSEMTLAVNPERPDGLPSPIWPSAYYEGPAAPIGLAARGAAISDPAVARTSLTLPRGVERLQSPGR